MDALAGVWAKDRKSRHVFSCRDFSRIVNQSMEFNNCRDLCGTEVPLQSVSVARSRALLGVRNFQSVPGQTRLYFEYFVLNLF